MSESLEEETPASETSPDLESTQALQQEVERLQQRIDELEGENKPTRSSALWVSVFTFLTLFFLLSLFQISMVYVITKFVLVYKGSNLWPNPDWTGTGPAGYRLPAFTEFFWTFKRFPLLHLFISLPVLVALPWFMGFKRFYLSRNTCRNIDRTSLCLYTGLIICWFIATYLPFQ